jgi:hypothetical protein
MEMLRANINMSRVIFLSAFYRTKLFVENTYFMEATADSQILCATLANLTTVYDLMCILIGAT